jgi:hypothetical protein
MDIDPKHTVDRDAQRELFAELLQFKSSARLLRVHGKPGTGKTALLKMLRYRCKYEWDKPVSLIPLQDFASQSNFDLILKIRQDLKELEFAEFDKLRGAYERQDAIAFAAPGGLSGKVDSRGATQSGGTTAGIIGTVNQPTNQFIATYISGSTSTWNEKYAEELCIEVFFRELKVVCAAQEGVLLLDSWDNDRISEERRDWLMDTLIKPYCLDAAARPDRLIAAVAGRDVPDFKAMWAGKHVDSVREKPLEVWGKDHFRDFLIVQEFKDLAPEDIEYVWGWVVNEGASLQDAIDYAVVRQRVRRRKAG